MNSLTSAERERRAAVLGIVLPPDAAPLVNGHKPKQPVLSLKPAPAKPRLGERYLRTGPLLEARFRLAFSAARPLAIGIYQRLREAISEEEIPTDDLRAFMLIWCRRKPYLDALARGVRRINLDGSDAGAADAKGNGSTI